MDPADLEQRAEAAYLGLALGDALGATVEFMTPREIRDAYGVHERMRGGGWLRLKCGQVTDDTTMALALGRSILEAGAVEPRAVASAFDAWMRGKPVDIGNTVRRGISRFRMTGEPAVPPSEYDAGNGACMRCLPVAFATLGATREEVAAASRAQAHVTHHNLLSDAACETALAMVQQSLLGTTQRDLLHRHARPLAEALPKFIFRDRRQDNPSGYIVETLRAVFQGFFDTDNFEDCLVDVVNRGGDSDTTGAIAGMLAGAYYGLDALPARWLRELDPLIRNACRDQARALLRLSPAWEGSGSGARIPPAGCGVL